MSKPIPERAPKGGTMLSRPIVLCAVAALLLAPGAVAMDFYVRHYHDSHEVYPGDGIAMDAQGYTTLRAAVEEANALPGLDRIMFSVPCGRGPCIFTVEPTLGEIVISDDLEIINPGNFPIVRLGDPTDGNYNHRGIRVLEGVHLKLVGIEIYGFSADFGGGILVEKDAILELTNSDIANCKAEQDGGGICVRGGIVKGSVAVTNCTAGNDGGGIYAESDAEYLSRLTLDSNTAGRYGGGIYHATADALAVKQVTIQNNTARRGAGVYSLSGLHLERGALVRNVATDSGGALALLGGTLSLVNVTLGENSAALGGALWLGAGVQAELRNCTVHRNTATTGAAAYTEESALLRLGNTLVSQNALGAEGSIEPVGPQFHSLGGNLFGPLADDFSAHPTDLTGVIDARLGPLQSPSFNGYYSPLVDSPALEGGLNNLVTTPPFTTLTDQIGSVARILGAHVDIGAIEYRTALPKPHTTDQDANRRIGLSELLRVIQFYAIGAFHCDAGTEDRFAPGADATAQACTRHSADYAPQDWSISLQELLRVVQLYNAGYYTPCEAGEDGFCPGVG